MYLTGKIFDRSLAWAAILTVALIALMLPYGEAVAQSAIETNGEVVDNLLNTVGDNHERMAYHLDSLISLGFVGLALFVAVALNHQNPSLRVWGVGAAAISCIAVGASLFAFELAEIRPPVIPLDAAKPGTINVLGLIFFAGGAFLSLVAYWQAQRTDTLALGARNEPQRYGRNSRYFHWVIAILFILLVPMGVYMTMIPEDAWYRQAYYVIHKSLGLSVLFLAIGRVAWLLMSPAPKLSPDLKRWEKFLAHSAHYTLYFFLFAFPLSGFVMSTYGGKLSHFFIWDFPLFWGPDQDAIVPFALLHKVILPYLFYLLIAAHLIGALKHQFIDKHADSFRRMAT